MKNALLALFGVLLTVQLLGCRTASERETAPAVQPLAARAKAVVDCTAPGRRFPARTVPECVDANGFTAVCGTPGSVRLWPATRFRPASAIPTSRDSTDRVAGNTVPGAGSGHESFSALAIVDVGGVSRRLYVSYNAGLQVWNIEANPARPAFLSGRDGWASQFLYFPPVNEVLNYIEDISAVNVDPTTDLVGVAGNEPVGPTLWEYRTATQQLVQKYQDQKTDGRQIRLVDTGAAVYAFVGADDGLAVYNVSAARALATPCLDSQGSQCPTVFRGFVGNTELKPHRYLDLLRVSATGKIFVASASGFFSDLELWRVDDPQQPGTAVLRASGVSNVYGTAIFRHNGHYYLAAIQEAPGLNDEKLRIFLIDGCITGGSCSLEDAVKPISLKAYPTANDYLTYSELHGNPYLYYGFATANQQGPDIEKLLDLRSLRPPSPQPLDGLPELTAGGESYTDPCNSSTIRYWSHYYPRNYHGLNTMVPRIGKFSSSGHFYRAANSILDVHFLDTGLLFMDGFESGEAGRWSSKTGG